MPERTIMQKVEEGETDVSDALVLRALGIVLFITGMIIGCIVAVALG